MAAPPSSRPRELSPRVRRVATLLLLGTLVLLGVYAASQDAIAEDLWWHLATGRYILAHREIPTADVFSYTHAGARWFNHEWLAQVLYFEIFQRFGGTALVLFKLVVETALFPLAAWVAWRRSGSLVLSAGVAGAAVFVCRPYLDVRPQLFSFVGALAVIGIVDTYRRGARGTILLLLPPIMALWVNLHASFLYGVAILAAFAGGELVKSAVGLPGTPMPLGRAFRLAAAAGTAALACLLNPDHVHGFTAPFAILGGGDPVWKAGLVEWLPPQLFRSGDFNPAFFGWYFSAQAVLTLAALLAAPRRFDVSDFAVVAGTAAMALSARRFVPLFALVSVPWGAANLAVVRHRLTPSAAGDGELARRRDAAVVSTVCVVTLAFLLLDALPEARRTFADGLFAGMTRAWYFPRAAAEFLRRNALPGRLFHPYVWGGYLIYELPERPVFIDPRAQTVYPAAFFREAMTAEFGQAGWQAVLDRNDVALVLWPSTDFAGTEFQVLFDRLNESPHWHCIYDDGHTSIFAHEERGRGWVDAYEAFMLDYPDVPGAQLFLAYAYLDANRFPEARHRMQEALRRFPSAEASARRTEERVLAEARASDAPDAWFFVAFYREVHGDPRAAVATYRDALERGLSGAQERYAREAIARLEPAASGVGVE